MVPKGPRLRFFSFLAHLILKYFHSWRLSIAFMMFKHHARINARDKTEEIGSNNLQLQDLWFVTYLHKKKYYINGLSTDKFDAFDVLYLWVLGGSLGKESAEVVGGLGLIGLVPSLRGKFSEQMVALWLVAIHPAIVFALVLCRSFIEGT